MHWIRIFCLLYLLKPSLCELASGNKLYIVLKDIRGCTVKELPVQPDEFNDNDFASFELKDGESEAIKYLEHLLEDGCIEGISETTPQLPPWYDAKLFKEAQGHFKKFQFFLIGFIATLFIQSFLKVMNYTKKLDTQKEAYRRFMKTYLEVSCWHSEPLELGSKIWKSISPVHSIHIQASRSCSKVQVGYINQEDLVLTQFCSIGILMLKVDQLNSNDEKLLDATNHMWRVIGNLMRITDECNICRGSWKETKPRFKIVMERVFRPSFVNGGPRFYKSPESLVEGVRSMFMVFTIDGMLYCTKKLAGCKGNELLRSDYADAVRNSKVKGFNYSFCIWDWMGVSTIIFTFMYMYRYTFVRWYLNFLGWVNVLLLIYFPYIAMFRYEWNWANFRDLLK